MDIDNIKDKDIEKSLMMLKTSINMMINKSHLIDFIRETVDKSPVIEFESDRARKFISKSRPDLRLRFITDKAKEVYPDVYDEEDEHQFNIYRHNVIHKEIISEINNVLSSIMSVVFNLDSNLESIAPEYRDIVIKLLDGKDVEELYNRSNQIFKKVKDGKEIVTMLVGMISATNFVPKNDPQPELFLLELMV